AITIQSKGDIAAQNLASNKDITLHTESGDLTVNTISAENSVTLTADSGAITGLSNGSANIQLADSIILKAAKDISALMIPDSILEAKVTGQGNIEIQSTGGITLKDIQTQNGAFDLVAAASITALNVDISGNVSMQNTSGDMTIDSINANGSTRVVTQNQLSIDQAVSSSQMNLQSTSGDIAIGSLTAETITLIADQGSITDAADDNLVDIQSNSVSLKASGNITDLELNI
ncbi:MAG: hypothetical protein OMM_15010, partial [Candidatus Magnetoglobus multicellularis str. Araruama]